MRYIIRKKYFEIAVVFILSLLFMPTPCYAAENFKIWNEGSTPTFSVNKNLNISFNKSVTIEQCKDSISVYREDTKEKIEVDFSKIEDGKTISVIPKTPYENGKSYVLIIGDVMESSDGKKIKQPVKYNFKINNIQTSNNVINDYSDFYNAIKLALSKYDSVITLTVNNYDKNIYNLDVINKVVEDYPSLRMGYDGATGTIEESNPAKFTISFKYNDSKEDLQNKQQQVQEKVNTIVNQVVKADMKDYEKEAALHDYVVNNAQYDKRLFTGNMPDDSYTAFGVLINGAGVCQGYADAMNRLLQAAGIESRMVVGEANDGSGWVGHAWNIVKIGGQYYHLDSTWDDPVTADGSSKLMHSYFNITDDQIAKDHRWNRDDYPPCNSTTYSFDNLNLEERDQKGNIITMTRSYDEFYNAIEQALVNGKKSVSLKVLNYDANVYDIRTTMNKLSNDISWYGGYRWSYYSDDINNDEYITINFI